MGIPFKNKHFFCLGKQSQIPQKMQENLVWIFLFHGPADNPLEQPQGILFFQFVFQMGKPCPDQVILRRQGNHVHCTQGERFFLFFRTGIFQQQSHRNMVTHRICVHPAQGVKPPPLGGCQNNSIHPAFLVKPRQGRRSIGLCQKAKILLQQPFQPGLAPIIGHQ